MRTQEPENCAQCGDYACVKVDWLLKAVPEAKERLDATRNKNRL